MSWAKSKRSLKVFSTADGYVPNPSAVIWYGFGAVVCRKPSMNTQEHRNTGQYRPLGSGVAGYNRDIRVSRCLKWVLIGVAFLLLLLAYSLDHKYPFPPLLRNDKIAHSLATPL